MHSAVAGTFVFVLQRFALNASLDTSRVWAVAFGIAAALLAWKQTER
jgi:hypothetical protein